MPEHVKLFLLERPVSEAQAAWYLLTLSREGVFRVSEG